MKLLIDLGNTRLKWAAWDGARLHKGGAAAHGDKLDFDALLQSIQKPDELWIASVAPPALDEQLARQARMRWQIEAKFVHSGAAACGVRSAYAQPQRLGVDRFLSLIAAHAHSTQPAVIASCGTALTLDALAGDGTHLGGLIAPAPELMRSALLGGTARLGEIDDAVIVEMAASTADAVHSGTWLAAVALVERFVAQAQRRLGAMQLDVVLSGGGAAQLGTLLAQPHRIDTELVLRGLAHFADHGGAVG